MNLKILAITLICIISGCYSLNRTELENAYYGNYPKNYKEIITEYMSVSLKDPESARYKFIDIPEKTYINNIFYKQFGYGICVHVNAKNSFGGYVGDTIYFFLIRDGRVIINEGDYNKTTGLSGIDLCSIMVSQRKDMGSIKDTTSNNEALSSDRSHESISTKNNIKNESFSNKNTNPDLDNLDKVSSQLKKLKELKELGIITNHEYEIKRKILVEKI